MASRELRLAMDPEDIEIELRDVDAEIIEMLEEGRCTRRHLAETLGYTGEYVYQRVTRLMEHGIVEKIHDGFYELATDGGEQRPMTEEEHAAAREAMDAQASEVRAALAEDLGGDPEDYKWDGGLPDDEDLRAIIADVDDIPQRFDVDEVLPAIKAALYRIRTDGNPTMRDLIADVMPAHPLGYDVPEDPHEGNRPRIAWWRKIVRPVLQQIDDVEQRGDGSWVWTGE